MLVRQTFMLLSNMPGKILCLNNTPVIVCVEISTPLKPHALLDETVLKAVESRVCH